MVMDIGRELREARVSSGLSQVLVAHRCGMAHSELQRIESGELTRIDPAKLVCVAETVGLRPSFRLYPHGDPLRDAGHGSLLRRARDLVHVSLGWQTEVPLPIQGDLRAWDAVIAGPRWRRPVEAETRFGDSQALARRIHLKQRDGAEEFVIVVAPDTRHNRLTVEAVRRALGPGFDGLPPRVLQALAAGEDPGIGAVLLI